MAARNKTLLSDATREYERFLNGQGLAANTIKGHRQTLGHLTRAVAAVARREDVYCDSIDGKHVAELFNANQWGPSTHNLHRQNANAFFAWLRARGYMNRDSDPMFGIRTRRRVQGNHQRIPLDEWDNLYAACLHPLDRLLLSLGLLLFLRGGEMANLKIGDVDLDNRVINVYREKTRRYDEMPISNELDTELRRWLAWYEQTAGSLRRNWYLAPARVKAHEWQVRSDETGTWVKGLSADTPVNPHRRITRPYNYIKAILDRAGYDVDGEGFHTLRRSGARALYDEMRDSGFDNAMEMVQAMLDHQSVETTQVYLDIRLHKVRRNEQAAGRDLFPTLGKLRAEKEQAASVATLHTTPEREAL